MVVIVSNPNEMDCESQFLKTHRILKWDEFIVLNNDRASINEKIANHAVTKHELLLQFKVELCLFNACKLKIEGMETEDVIDTQVLVILTRRIVDLFDHMHILFSIEEGLLSCYINFCQDNVINLKAEQLDFLLEAVLDTADNQNIWIQLLELHLKLNNLEKMINVFQQGVRSLKNDSLPLWKMIIEHLQTRRPDMAETLFEEGSNISYENVSMEMRPKYLKWCMKYKDINAARNLFNELKNLTPQCVRLYLTMISIESEVPDFELDTIRKLYDEVCTLFGRFNVGVWIDYIRFEHTDGSQKLLNSIYNKALWNLESNLKDTFADEFIILKQEFRKDLSNEIIVIDD